MASLPRSRARPSGAPAIVAVAIVLLGLLGLHIPYFALEPGPAENVLKLISIQGAKTQPVTGKLLLTTVSLHEIRVVEAVVGLFRPDYQVISRAALVGPGETPTDVEIRTAQQMSESQIFAAAAALRYLGYPVRSDPSGVRVEDFSIQAAPAAAILHLGDVIVGMDGSTIRTSADLKNAMRRHKPGDTVSLKVVRATKTLEVRTKTIGQAGTPILGIYPSEVPQVRLPLAVSIKSLGIGGPSAGLMFAVGIVDLLSKPDFARGRIIAGTGEITVDGHVKAIGGVQEKVAGARKAHAQLFLVPRDDSREACAVSGDLPIAVVNTLAEAITVLRDPHAAAARACR